jgi:hypothetical protein
LGIKGRGIFLKKRGFAPLGHPQIIYQGREHERGLSPLSFILPSPAINIWGCVTMIPAGEGIKGRG